MLAVVKVLARILVTGFALGTAVARKLHTTYNRVSDMPHFLVNPGTNLLDHSSDLVAADKRVLNLVDALVNPLLPGANGTCVDANQNLPIAYGWNFVLLNPKVLDTMKYDCLHFFWHALSFARHKHLLDTCSATD